MYYEKRGDPFPVMEDWDEVPNKRTETNDFRRQLNKYHWAFGEMQRRIDEQERALFILAIAQGVTFVLAAVAFIALWV